jgi:protein involved in polysaccharide export with SLBB domain
MAEPGAAGRNRHVADCYAVHFPDVVALKVDGRPHLTGLRAVGPDGCIDVDGQRVRIAGQTAPEVARRVALATGTPAHGVSVRVADYESQQVYLFGPGIGVQRAVEYQGPETVLDLLQRTGGITAGAAPNDVYVVRPRVVEDLAPEIFHINLRGILLNDDPRTNIRLQPFDQVFIGETRQASLQKCVPPWFRPVYETFCGLSRQ